MTDSSPRMQWPYPAENADPWLDDFRAFIAAADASGFASREDRNLLIMGGGTVSWNGGTGVLSWTAAIEFLSPNTGFLNQIPAGSVTLADGEVARGNLARALGGNASMAVSAAGYALSNDNSVVMCIRRGSNLYWRNGLLMANGDSVTNVGSTQGSGAVVLAGDVTGSAGANTVEALWNLPIDPGIAPNANDVLQWDGSQWVAAAVASGGATAVFVFRPGGVAAGNVYITWAALYAAVNAVEGQVIVQIEDSLAAAQIPAGVYDFTNWTIVGEYDPVTGLRPTLTILTGVTITGNFRLERLVFQLDAGATAPITASYNPILIEMLDSEFNGGIAANGLVTGFFGPPVQVVMRGVSVVTSSAFLLLGVAVQFTLYDRSRLAADACAGSGAPIVARAIDNETVRIEVQSGYAGSLSIETPHEVMNGPLNASQLGTTELHIGSVYLLNGQRILASSSAMLGGAIVADTGSLRMRRFTGGALIATWSTTGTITDTQLGADVSITNDDWYDLYLFSGGAAETAVIKGLRLLAVRE